MLREKGQTFPISLRPIGEDGELLPDSPYATLQNRVNKEYFDGIGWNEQPYHFLMDRLGSAFYYEFLLDMVGSFEVVASSLLDPKQIKAERVDVYDGRTAAMYAVKEEPYRILFATADTNITPGYSVQRSDSKYLQEDGSWDFSPHSFSMELYVEPDIFSSEYTPEQSGEYLILCDSNSESHPETNLILLKVFDSEDEIIPITVSSETLRSDIGDDSVVKDGEEEFPLSDVRIIALDQKTRKSVNEAVTDPDGKWVMGLRPGRYLFVFRKDGYEDFVLERQVAEE